jgi:hypothetical protein
MGNANYDGLRKAILYSTNPCHFSQIHVHQSNNLFAERIELSLRVIHVFWEVGYDENHNVKNKCLQ